MRLRARQTIHDIQFPATTGYCAHSATTGDSAHSATTGYYAHSATTGDYAHSATTGESAHSATSGKNSISCAIGKDSWAKGAKGNWIVLSEIVWNGTKNVVKSVKTAKVDGKKIKEDTYYKLEGGKFVEA